MLKTGKESAYLKSQQLCNSYAMDAESALTTASLKAESWAVPSRRDIKHCASSSVLSMPCQRLLTKEEDSYMRLRDKCLGIA
jgi:hypothetical protein